MKKYFVFCWNNYYPYGGFNDFQGAFETLEEAQECALAWKNEYWEGLEWGDMHNYCIADITTLKIIEGDDLLLP